MKKCDQNMFLSLKRLSIQRMERDNFHDYFKTHLSESMEIAKKRVMNNFLVRNCMCRRCRRKEAFYEFIGNAPKETALSSTTFNVRDYFKH